jgi:hypothetical protein
MEKFSGEIKLDDYHLEVEFNSKEELKAFMKNFYKGKGFVNVKIPIDNIKDHDLGMRFRKIYEEVSKEIDE